MTEQAARSAVIHTPFIELDKLLKRENLAATGGEAGLLIAAGLVRVNGEIERRKRRKFYPGDRVVTDKDRLMVVAEQHQR